MIPRSSIRLSCLLRKVRPRLDQSFVGGEGSLFNFQKTPKPDFEARFDRSAMGQRPKSRAAALERHHPERESNRAASLARQVYHVAYLSI